MSKIIPLPRKQGPETMVSVPLSSLHELIREFAELKEMWRDTKESFNRINQVPPVHKNNLRLVRR